MHMDVDALDALSDVLSDALHATIRQTLQPYRTTRALDASSAFQVVLAALISELMSCARGAGMTDGDIRDLIERALLYPVEITTEQVH